MSRRLVALAVGGALVAATTAYVAGAQSSGDGPDLAGIDGDYTVDFQPDRIIFTAITEVPPSTSTTSTSSAPTPTSAPTTTVAASTTTVAATSSTAATTTTGVPSSTSTSTTTTVAATTTTSVVPPTTTIAPTTTAPAPTTTTPPPSGFQWFDDFAASTSVDRYDWQLHSAGSGHPPQHCGDGVTACGLITATDRAEHNMACGSPTTFRHIDAQPVHDFLVINPNVSPLIWYCNPGNTAASGHVMTAIETEGVVTLSMSPKQTFTNVTKVCFDVNTNDNIGAGKWVNLWVVPTSSIAANGGRFDFADAPDLDPNAYAPGPNDWHMKYMDGSLLSSTGLDWWEWYRRASESATRFTQCAAETGPNQITYTRDLPCDGPDAGTEMDPGVCETQTRTGTGQLPNGTVRVILQDSSYNPDKHGGAGDNPGSSPMDFGITWHFDNVTVE